MYLNSIRHNHYHIDYLQIENKEIKGEVKFDLYRSYPKRDNVVPVFKKIQIDKSIQFVSGYIFNEVFIQCPITIFNVTIENFELINGYLISSLSVYTDYGRNEGIKIKNFKVKTNNSYSRLSRMVNSLNIYIDKGKAIDNIDTIIFESDILDLHYDYKKLIEEINNLKFEFYEVYVCRVGKDDDQWIEVNISNFPKSYYLSELLKNILGKYKDLRIFFDIGRCISFGCETYEDRGHEEIIKDHLKYNIKEYFNPEFELLDRMSLH